MRKNNLILSIITLIFAHILYFIWLPYPKGFLKGIENKNFVFDLITNLIFFSAFTVILLVSISSITKPGNKLSKKRVAMAIFAILCVQLGVDSIGLVVECALPRWVWLSDEFFTLLKTFAFVYVICKVLSVKQVKWKRFFVIIIPFSIAALSVFLLLDIHDINAMAFASDKYLLYPSEPMPIQNYPNPSSYLNDIASNLQFLHEIRNGVFDALTVILMTVALYYSVVPKYFVKDENSFSRKSHLFSRTAAVLLLAFVFCMLKVLILPYDALGKVNRGIIDHDNSGFSLSSNTVTVNRMLDRKNLSKVYCRTYFSLRYDNKIISKFYIDGEQEAVTHELQGNVISVNENYDCFNINGTDVIVCYDKVIAYLKDGIPYVIPFEDIKSSDYDQVLSELCKQFTELGEMKRFEYVCEYLNKYEPEFIKPYLERYCTGEFTEKEMNQIGDMNPEYLVKYVNGIIGQ